MMKYMVVMVMINYLVEQESTNYMVVMVMIE